MVKAFLREPSELVSLSVRSFAPRQRFEGLLRKQSSAGYAYDVLVNPCDAVSRWGLHGVPASDTSRLLGGSLEQPRWCVGVRVEVSPDIVGGIVEFGWLVSEPPQYSPWGASPVIVDVQHLPSYPH